MTTRSGSAWMVAFAAMVAAVASARQPANDLCANATELALDAPCPECVPFGGFWYTIAGSTQTATVDGEAPGCGGAGNVARGVWYRFVGRGNRVLLSTSLATGTTFDTQISVYCGDSCGALGCVAYNDDTNDTVAGSELELCAAAGRTYWILVAGYGSTSASGNFVLLFGEPRDSMGDPIPCCDASPCTPPEAYIIPPNAVQEMGMIPGPTGPEIVPEDCATVIDPPDNIAVNNGCNLAPPPGFVRQYGFITVGQPIWGHLWSRNQSRDTDWFLLEDLPIGNILVHYQFFAEGPVRPRWYYNSANVDFFDCTPALGFVGGDQPGHMMIDAVQPLDSTARSRTGQMPGGTVGFRLFHMANGAGYPCGTNTRYWFTVLEATPVAQCPEIVAPPTADVEEFAPTYEGFQFGEPCGVNAPNQRLGCGADPINDNAFIRIRPNVPMLGAVYGDTNAQGGLRDLDYYKFDLAQRSIINLRIESPGLFNALITENSCDNDAIVYALAATRGTCLAETIDAPDLVALDAGTYILLVHSRDPFATAGAFINVATACTDPTSKYLIWLDAEPVPACPALCPQGALVEVEPCVATEPAMFDACAASLDNDGCSRAPFSAQAIAPGDAACGSLYSVYVPSSGAQPDERDRFAVDQDDWTFTLPRRSEVRFGAAADGPVRVRLVKTGPDGSLCEDGAGQVVAEIDAGQCMPGAEQVAEVGPGTYALNVAPGSVDVGLSFGDYACGKELHYAVSLAVAEACCLGNADHAEPGMVDFGDITHVLAHYGAVDESGLGLGDADCDGAVSFVDVTYVLANFGNACE